LFISLVFYTGFGSRTSMILLSNRIMNKLIYSIEVYHEIKGCQYLLKPIFTSLKYKFSLLNHNNKEVIVLQYHHLQSLIEHSSSSRQYFLSLPIDIQLQLHQHNDAIHTLHQLHQYVIYLQHTKNL